MPQHHRHHHKAGARKYNMTDDAHHQVLRKLEANLAELAQTDARRQPVALVLSGSFNPPHLMHVETLSAARRNLERDGKRRVVAGFLCPSSDHYVRNKLGLSAALSLGQRNELCELITLGSDWVSVGPWGEPSVSKCIERLQPMVGRLHGGVLLMPVCGADTCLRHDAHQHVRPYVVIGRPGHTEQMIQAKVFSSFPTCPCY